MPELQHAWVDRGAIVTLRFPPIDSTGFEVAIQVGDGYIYVLMGNNHHSFSPTRESVDESMGAALGLARDLLSPDMRLRELRAGGMPYKWLVEARSGDGWQLEAETGLLFYNYFGRRTEHLFQNRQLPGRLVAG
jgi:hypothetical protein